MIRFFLLFVSYFLALILTGCGSSFEQPASTTNHPGLPGSSPFSSRVEIQIERGRTNPGNDSLELVFHPASDQVVVGENQSFALEDFLRQHNLSPSSPRDAELVFPVEDHHQVQFLKVTDIVRNDDGSLKEAWCQAEAWDTAIAGERLLEAGDPASDPLLKNSIAELLKSQGADGRWSFATNAETSLDNDSSTMPLGFLASSFATAAPDQKELIKAAVKKCAETLLNRQQHDGGWNAYEPTKLGWGGRVPSSFEASAVDGSSPDVTGRVLRALGTARKAGLLDESQERKLDGAVQNACEYLQDSQAPNGSWWSRWIAGYITTPGFVLGGLAEVGVDMNQPWIKKSVDFLKSHQNADGGWGEETFADQDVELAGVGSSTPSQTSLAMWALMSAAGDHSEALDKGAEYLVEAQKDGRWSNNKKLYTTIPGDVYYDSDHNTHCVSAIVLHKYLNR